MASKLNREELNAARVILEHPLTAQILDDMESSAVNNAVNAKLTDTETAAAWLAEVRAIRNFRSKLAFIVADGEETLKRERAGK